MLRCSSADGANTAGACCRIVSNDNVRSKTLAWLVNETSGDVFMIGSSDLCLGGIARIPGITARAAVKGAAGRPAGRA